MRRDTEPRANQHGGQDYAGPFGIARWTQEDGHRKIMLLNGLEQIQWSVEVMNAAPRGIFDFAWQEAQWATDGVHHEPLPPIYPPRPARSAKGSS